jgi:O-antigen/teichoic acid export membrane protein
MFKGVTEDLTTIRWVVMIVGLNVSVQLLGQVFGATLVGLKRFDLVNLVGVASNVLQGVLMVVTLRLGGGLIGMACSVLAVGVLARLAEDVLALRLLPHISLSWTYFDRALLKTLFRFGALNVLIVIKLRFIDSIGGVITGVILRVDKVPFYAVAENLCRHAVATAKGVAQVAMPLASQLEAQKRQQDLVRVLILGPRVLTTLALTMIVVVTVLGRSLLRLWLDEEFATQAFGALCVLMIARGVEICSLSLFTMLVGMDRMVFLSRLAVLEIVIVVGLGASLTATIGVAGMAWATLVSQVLVHGAILPRFACREIGYPWHRWVVQVFAPAATATLPALALAVAFHTYWPPEQLGVLVAQIVCVVGLAAASGFVMCLEPSMRADVLRVFLPKRIGDVP